MGLLPRPRTARALKTQKRPLDPVRPAPPSHGAVSPTVIEPPPVEGLPLTHDACIYAQLLMQARWQLADARRENNELYACLRRLLQQMQS